MNVLALSGDSIVETGNIEELSVNCLPVPFVLNRFPEVILKFRIVVSIAFAVFVFSASVDIFGDDALVTADLMDDFLKADVEPTIAFIRTVDEVVFCVVVILRFGSADTSDSAGEFFVNGLSQLIVLRNMGDVITVEMALMVVFGVGVIETDETVKLVSCCFVPVIWGIFIEMVEELSFNRISVAILALVTNLGGDFVGSGSIVELALLDDLVNCEVIVRCDVVDILDGDETCCSMVAVGNVLSGCARVIGLVFCLAGLDIVKFAIEDVLVPVVSGDFLVAGLEPLLVGILAVV